MDNYTYIHYHQQDPTGFTDCCKFSNTPLICFIIFKAVTKKFAELTNATLTPLILKRGEKSYWQGLLQISE